MPALFSKSMFWILRKIALALPDGPFANQVIGIPRFLIFHHRFPRPKTHPQANFADYIFSKNAGPWTAFQRECVDKEKAKALVQTLCPTLRTTRTFAVWTLSKQSTFEDAKKFLRPYGGEKCVAKPAHSSGGVVLMDRIQPGQLEKLFHVASRDHFLYAGEGQYRNLPRRILVEQSLAPAGQPPPTDYRFYCSFGKTWFGAADAGRFVDLREYHFTVPQYAPVYIQTHGRYPAKLPARPRRFREMIKIAERLSKPFEFVRVDLYETPKAVYFGEFTFTPLAGLFKLSNRALSRWLQQKALNPNSSNPFLKEWLAKNRK